MTARSGRCYQCRRRAGRNRRCNIENFPAQTFQNLLRGIKYFKGLHLQSERLHLRVKARLQHAGERRKSARAKATARCDMARLRRKQRRLVDIR